MRSQAITRKDGSSCDHALILATASYKKFVVTREDIQPLGSTTGSISQKSSSKSVLRMMI
jgi:hypothetical protein